jgi:hypothetical protein
MTLRVRLFLNASDVQRFAPISERRFKADFRSLQDVSGLLSRPPFDYRFAQTGEDDASARRTFKLADEAARWAMIEAASGHAAA